MHHRSIEGYMTDTSIFSAVDEFQSSLRDKLAEKSGYSQLATYSNFARKIEDPASWFSKVKLRRLSSLKKHWDPNRLFNYDKPIC